MLSCSIMQLFVTLWTVACQAPLSMGFSRHEYWSGLPCPPSGDLSDPGIKPESLTFHQLADGFFTTRATWECMCMAEFLRCLPETITLFVNQLYLNTK